jgi:hypothetical protein
MHAVRRALATAGLTGLLLATAGTAWAADPTPSADPSASPTASADPSATPAPTDSPEPSAEPTVGGCDQNPVICQSGGVPGGTVDCGQVGPNDEPVASPPPDGVICIASGLNPGEVTQVSSGSGSGAGAPRTLPRTGPSRLPITLGLGGGLLLLGLVATLTGRRTRLT